MKSFSRPRRPSGFSPLPFALVIGLGLSDYARPVRAEEAATSPGARRPAPNTLSPEEKRQGFVLLFDGESATGWRGFNRETLPSNGWKVSEGTLHFEPVAEGCDKPGDIITVDQYDNFELRLDWKLEPGGNSGVKYLIDESMVKSGHGGLGFEMQILDDERHPDAKKGIAGNRTAGALYDLIPPEKAMAKPPGEWNEARLVVNGNHVEHWLNGQRVVTYERDSQMLRALINTSKYKDAEGFGRTQRGHILLQDHGDRVWYRNIRVRRLPAPKPARARS